MKKLFVLFLMITSLLMITSCKPKEYTITLKFEDGTVFETLVVEKETSVNLNTPTKDGYTFKGWYEGDILVDGKNGFDKDTTLICKFNINSYTYKFIVDGVIIKEETAVYNSNIVYPENPVKESTQQYSYLFKEWDNTAIVLLKDEVFNAVFESTTNQYTYKFVDTDGTVLKETTADYGTEIVAPNDPLKEGNAEFSYTFAGWDKDVTILTEDVTFTATYTETKNKYTYKFVDENGTVLKEETADYGTEIVAPSDPVKEGNAEFSYAFAGWDKDVTILTEDVTFTATYTETKNKYTYKFVDVDGTVLKEETCDYGTKIVAPSDPTKVGNAEFSYTFAGWDKDATILIEDVTFTATYTETINQYTYKFVDDNGKVLKQEKVDYGTEIIAPTNPEKAPTAEYTYTFTGWDKEFTIVTGNITITAVYSKVKNQYTYKFVDEDGTILKEETVDYGTMPIAPENPKKEATDEYEYKFVGWDKNISKVIADVVYTAVYEEKEIKGEITSLEGLKISFLGDSISTFYAEGSEMNSYYGGENEFFYPRYSHSIKTVDLTWWCKLIKNNNMVLGVNNSWSGSQACGSGNSAGQSDYRINTINENGNPDIVIVYLGTNDLGSSRTISDLESAITNIINKINAKCDTQIFLTTLGYSAYSGGSYTDANRVLYNAKLRELAAKFECGIVPLDEYVVDDNYMIYLEDSLHYNAKGANLLSLIAEKALKDYYNISFDKEIVVEHQEPLPEGAVGVITATSNSNFWGTYATDVFLGDSSFTNAPYSHRIEITKNTENGKYYVSKITKSGESTTFNCDFVLVISEANEEYRALLAQISNVQVGNIVEFDESLNFPIEIIFKEGDGNTPSTPVVPEPDPEVNPPVEGQLHIAAYNTGVWTDYDKTAILYTNDAIDKASTYINFYIIKLTYDETKDKYQITGLKTIDIACTFDDCDLYVLIYRDFADKTYFETAQEGNYVVINGDMTTGSCNILFE
ncbi:MAG: hypothetical protein E7183_03025 [Erysipelotrichaceae bacterium]|nr:hypothetical protein [Erysipelotrichaceae bacterium]